MKVSFLRHLFLGAAFSVFLFLLSCASLPAKNDKEIKNIDKKIFEDFQKQIGEGNFFEACRSYIEYVACCADDDRTEMISALTELYWKKMSEFRASQARLEMVSHTYSLLNILADNPPPGEAELSDLALSSYIKAYVEKELSDVGDLEKVSWLLHMSHFLPDDAFIYKSLSETLIKGKNELLARKYFEKLRSSLALRPEPEYGAAERELSAAIGQLAEQNAGESPDSERVIEDAIRSSVKIVVDRGIKTEGGVGLPDQLIGTGVVIDERGYIITNYHIIESSVDPKYEGYSRVYIIPGKDETVKLTAKIIGYDEVFDLALLKIEKKIDSFIRFGDSDMLKQGERVVAIGNPVGLTNTVTSGVVSSMDRPFLQIGNIIQIDAALNPGNSGGALIDTRGYLVGIAFAGLEQFQNLNFAIPSNLLLSLLYKLYAGGKAARSWVGSSVEKSEDGIVINYIVPEGPSDVARIARGDIIKEVNGRPVTEIFDIQNVISSLDNPLVVNLTIERDGKVVKKHVLLAQRPELPSSFIYKKDAYENIITPLFGIVLTSIDIPRKKSYTVSRVVGGSAASAAGISEGDQLRVRNLKYDEEAKVFTLNIELKSKRFGYIGKSMVLYTYADTNSFI